MKAKSYKCPLCGGKVVEKRIKLDLWIKGKLIVIEGVPADVCDLCGEQAFSPATSKKIDRLLKRAGKPKAEAVVPIFSFA